MENGVCKVCQNFEATSATNMARNMKAEITHYMQTTKMEGQQQS
jgi:cytochrome c-type biogenesis protein CcmH/NrfF